MQNSHYHEWVTRNVTCSISFTDSTSIEETIERITKSAGEQIKYFNNGFQNRNMYVEVNVKFIERRHTNN